MIYQNTIVQLIAFFIPNKELRHNFRNKYKRKTKYRKLRDENILLRQEVERLKAQCISMQNEYKTLFALSYPNPEQRRRLLIDRYRACTRGQKLDLDNPKKWSEKIQWIKLYDMDDLKTRLADKYLVREWIKEKIGEKYLIPLLGAYDGPDEIDYDSLPEKFVIKCNHGCSMNIIVKDKNTIDKEEIKNKLNTWLKRTYGFMGFELQYLNIRPRVIIEKHMENAGRLDIIDYKFWCFNGKPKYIHVFVERSTNKKATFFDTNWVKQSFAYNFPLIDYEMEKPDNLDKMLSIAETLSKDFKFVRVDLYRLDDGSIYFGEMTFTPWGGWPTWNEADIDRKLGDLLKL